MMTSTSFDISLALSDLDARRGGKVVASGISFCLEPRGALVLRGENGSGKTSVLRAIAGFSRNDAGAVCFQQANAELDAAEVRARSIHWLGGGDGIADRLTVEENVASWARLLGAPTAQIAPTLARLGINALKSRPAGKLSTGQRRRLGCARVIMAPRAIWLLDEPFNGLDETARGLILSAIADHRENGGVVLMASHDDGLPDAPTLRLTPAPVAA